MVSVPVAIPMTSGDARTDLSELSSAITLLISDKSAKELAR